METYFYYVTGTYFSLTSVTIIEYKKMLLQKPFKGQLEQNELQMRISSVVCLWSSSLKIQAQLNAELPHSSVNFTWGQQRCQAVLLTVKIIPH